MSIEISNQWLAVEFDVIGSEWTKIIDKTTGLNYAWGGDEKWWTGRNPTLFPVVGKPWQETIEFEGRKYPLGNHGFARRSQFTLGTQTAESVTLSLTDSQATREHYPFAFQLTNHYQLAARTLQVTTTVANRDQKELPFSVGAHPAFNCPLLPTESFTDYKIVFEQPEDLVRLKMNPLDSSFLRERVNYGNQISQLPLTRALFTDDALVFEHLRSRWVRLVGPTHQITLTLPTDCPWFGIWTKGDAPFICLEPWFGHGDFAGFTGEFSQREGIMLLPPGEQFAFTYQIELN